MKGRTMRRTVAGTNVKGATPTCITGRVGDTVDDPGLISRDPICQVRGLERTHREKTEEIARHETETRDETPVFLRGNLHRINLSSPAISITSRAE